MGTASDRRWLPIPLTNPMSVARKRSEVLGTNAIQRRWTVPPAGAGGAALWKASGAGRREHGRTDVHATPKLDWAQWKGFPSAGGAVSGDEEAPRPAADAEGRMAWRHGPLGTAHTDIFMKVTPECYEALEAEIVFDESSFPSYGPFVRNYLRMQLRHRLISNETYAGSEHVAWFGRAGARGAPDPALLLFNTDLPQRSAPERRLLLLCRRNTDACGQCEALRSDGDPALCVCRPWVAVRCVRESDLASNAVMQEHLRAAGLDPLPSRARGDDVEAAADPGDVRLVDAAGRARVPWTRREDYALKLRSFRSPVPSPKAQQRPGTPSGGLRRHASLRQPVERNGQRRRCASFAR